MDNKKNKWRGYIFSREIGDYIIPQRIQNLVIRQYVEKHSKEFLLSLCEYDFENCYIMLRGMLNVLQTTEAIVFYSVHMLPHEKTLRQSIIEEILEGESELHFALENLVVSGKDDIPIIEDIFLAKELTCRDLDLVFTR